MKKPTNRPTDRPAKRPNAAPSPAAGNPEPLASPYEVADIALRLTALSGDRKPDLAGAVDLLFRAREMILLQAKAEKVAPTDSTPPRKTLSDYYAGEFENLKKHSKAHLIKEPTNYPISFDELVRRVSGVDSISRRKKIIWRAVSGQLQLWDGDKKDEPIKFSDAEREAKIQGVVSSYESCPVVDLDHFQKLAAVIFPHCPRFATDR